MGCSPILYDVSCWCWSFNHALHSAGGSSAARCRSSLPSQRGPSGGLSSRMPKHLACWSFSRWRCRCKLGSIRKRSRALELPWRHFWKFEQSIRSGKLWNPGERWYSRQIIEWDYGPRVYTISDRHIVNKQRYLHELPLKIPNKCPKIRRAIWQLPDPSTVYLNTHLMVILNLQLSILKCEMQFPKNAVSHAHDLSSTDVFMLCIPSL